MVMGGHEWIATASIITSLKYTLTTIEILKSKRQLKDMHGSSKSSVRSVISFMSLHYCIDNCDIVIILAKYLFSDYRGEE